MDKLRCSMEEGEFDFVVTESKEVLSLECLRKYADPNINSVSIYLGSEIDHEFFQLFCDDVKYHKKKVCLSAYHL